MSKFEEVSERCELVVGDRKLAMFGNIGDTRHWRVAADGAVDKLPLVVRLLVQSL